MNPLFCVVRCDLCAFLVIDVNVVPAPDGKRVGCVPDKGALLGKELTRSVVNVHIGAALDGGRDLYRFHVSSTKSKN